jgi:imidazole glycerol-phosphate synthase subunit HisH
MTAIVKYNAGNVQSVLHALQRLGEPAVWTDDPAVLHAADRVIFPGVGEASSAMRYLRERGLDGVVCSLQQPVLGICLGLQLFCQHSEEADTACLGIFPSTVRRFESGTGLKVPHIGWNSVKALSGPLWAGIAPDSQVYFVHSYYAEQCAEANAICQYGVPFSAGLGHNNFYAVQFHPEKSGRVGAQILQNFLRIEP